MRAGSAAAREVLRCGRTRPPVHLTELEETIQQCQRRRAPIVLCGAQEVAEPICDPDDVGLPGVRGLSALLPGLRARGRPLERPDRAAGHRGPPGTGSTIRNSARSWRRAWSRS